MPTAILLNLIKVSSLFAFVSSYFFYCCSDSYELVAYFVVVFQLHIFQRLPTSSCEKKLFCMKHLR